MELHDSSGLLGTSLEDDLVFAGAESSRLRSTVEKLLTKVETFEEENDRLVSDLHDAQRQTKEYKGLYEQAEKVISEGARPCPCCSWEWPAHVQVEHRLKVARPASGKMFNGRASATGSSFLEDSGGAVAQTTPTACLASMFDVQTSPMVSHPPDLNVQTSPQASRQDAQTSPLASRQDAQTSPTSWRPAPLFDALTSPSFSRQDAQTSPLLAGGSRTLDSQTPPLSPEARRRVGSVRAFERHGRRLSPGCSTTSLHESLDGSPGTPESTIVPARSMMDGYVPAELSTQSSTRLDVRQDAQTSPLASRQDAHTSPTSLRRAPLLRARSSSSFSRQGTQTSPSVAGGGCVHESRTTEGVGRLAGTISERAAQLLYTRAEPLAFPVKSSYVEHLKEAWAREHTVLFIQTNMKVFQARTYLHDLWHEQSNPIRTLRPEECRPYVPPLDFARVVVGDDSVDLENDDVEATPANNGPSFKTALQYLAHGKGRPQSSPAFSSTDPVLGGALALKPRGLSAGCTRGMRRLPRGHSANSTGGKSWKKQAMSFHYRGSNTSKLAEELLASKKATLLPPGLSDRAHGGLASKRRSVRKHMVYPLRPHHGTGDGFFQRPELAALAL